VNKWDERFFEVARLVAGWSKDRSTRVGCVIVQDRRILSTGYNGFPRGCDDTREDRHERPIKYYWAEHAERNAVYNASRAGIVLLGSTAYVTMFPCADCARALVQSGVARVVAPIANYDCERWGASFRVARNILLEGGCRYSVMHGCWE
jgi:dCMP deaminase